MRLRERPVCVHPRKYLSLSLDLDLHLELLSCCGKLLPGNRTVPVNCCVVNGLSLLRARGVCKLCLQRGGRAALVYQRCCCRHAVPATLCCGAGRSNAPRLLLGVVSGLRSLHRLTPFALRAFLVSADGQELSGGSLHLLGEGACKLCHRGGRSSCHCATCCAYHTRQ